MHLNSQQLQRFNPAARRPETPDDAPAPPDNRDVVLIGAGNSGESVALRCYGLAYRDNIGLHAVGLNNDRLAPRPVGVYQSHGALMPLALADRLVLDDESPRDRIADDPLLARRYQALLRGIAVFEDHPRAGSGGSGHAAISALDIDLNIDLVLGWLRRALHTLRAAPADIPGQTDVQRIVAQRRPREQANREKRIVLIGGACGAMGNASHQLLPYLIRHVLAEQGLRTYELWGVLLGPCAFSGLTPFTRANFRALLEAIEHMSRYGQHRRYANDLEIAMQRAPFDRVFLLDDPRLPGVAASVTEPELERFLDQSALSLYTLLRGTTWQTIASHTANDDGVARADGRLRYLHTARAATLRADPERLREVLAAGLALRTLDQFVTQFGT